MREPGKLIYLDNAATTYPKPECVYQAADEFYRRYGGNAGRGANPLARKSAELIAETRAMLTDWLGAPSPERVIFTPSATIALNLAILGTKLRSGDAVYVTPFEHNSVLRPVEHLRQTMGVVVQELPFDRHTMACQFDRLAAQFRADPPALVCMTQASNVCGVMPPVIEVAQSARESNPNVVVVVDGAQVAGLHPLSLDDGLIDAYIFSGHKSLYGPYGVAGLVLASDWRPEPILFGGTGTISESVAMPGTLPSAYEPGSHNVWAIAGLKAALEWLRETGPKAIVAHTLELAESLRDELEKLSSVQVHGPPKGEQWCGIVSFSVEGVRPQAIETALGAKGIAVRAGLHCAPLAHRFLGTTSSRGTVRASPSQYSTQVEVERCIKELRRLVLVRNVSTI
jgi:cysteine desulfurase family protein